MTNIINKYKNYTTISNLVLSDPELSLEEKGLFCYLFSKPDDWEFHYNVMKKELKEKSNDTIRKIMSKLVEKGYITKIQIKDIENNTFGGIKIQFLDKGWMQPYHKNADTANTPNGKNADTANLVPNNTNISNNTDLLTNTKDINTLPLAKEKSIKPIINEIYELFNSLYKKHTGNKYLAKKHEFVLLTNIVKQFDKQIIINKIYLFEAMCENKVNYFTKNGFSDFTIGKLVSEWNKIVAEKETEGSFVASVFGEE